MPIYRRHASATTEWSGVALVPSKGATESDCEVWFALPHDSDQDDDEFWEALNGQLCEDGLVEVRAVPALAYGVTFGDRVSVIRSAEGALVAESVRERGPFATFRLLLGHDESLAGDWRPVAEKYAQLGCLIDVYSENLIALACPRDRVEIVRDALEAQASVSEAEWEEGFIP